MQKHLIMTTLFLISCAKLNQAQEPKWELFARGLHGPIAVDPTNNNVVYTSFEAGGVPLGGMWKTTDGGKTWNQYKNGWLIGSARHILIDPQNPNTIIVGGLSLAAAMIRSIDGGQNWFRADTGVVPDHHGYLVWSLALDKQRRIFYAAHDGIFGGLLRSTDGVHWQLPNPDFNPTHFEIIVDERTGVLYAGTGNGVWKSPDDGNNWTQISSGLPFQSPTPPISYPSIWHVAKIRNGKTLYCAVSNRGIYKSFDSGTSWLSVNDSITSKLSFRGGIVAAEKDTNTIYAGAGATLTPALPGGIYRSQNGGKSWTLYNRGLPDTVLGLGVTNLFLDNRANTLYASIGSVLPNGRSEEHLYRLREAAATAVREPRQQNLPTQPTLYSYPNPFKNQTTFFYSIHEPGQITFRIYDILGKEVVTLLNEHRGPGEYRIPWDGTKLKGRKLSSGIYLARLQFGNEVKIIKLLLTQ